MSMDQGEGIWGAPAFKRQIEDKERPEAEKKTGKGHILGAEGREKFTAWEVRHSDMVQR